MLSPTSVWQERLAEFQNGVPRVNMHFLLLTRPEEVKMGSRQSREANSRLAVDIIRQVCGEILRWAGAPGQPSLA
jgi:hypothetical protein